ncbi:MAG: MBOAT family O-acyltransferase [Bacteroidota bacterium]|nr:MBOAT family O-acyltransferase [Bacteroidota bacterium]
MSIIDLNKFLNLFVYDPKSPMLFNTGFFMFLFLVFIFFYQFVEKNKTIKVLYLIAFSYFFYYKSSGIFFTLLIFSTIVDYYLAKWIDKTEHKAGRKAILIISLLVNFGLLGYFKYTNFFIDIVNDVSNKNISHLNIFLPIGISFYIFQSLSYTIDIYRKKLKPLSSIFDFSFYISFFPHIVAGPIVRAIDFLPQIRKNKVIDRFDIGYALYLIIGGLFKKAIISDYISINFVDRVFDNPTLYSGFENLMAVYGYALQIYCDFSGYSDMAIGIALLLGYRLKMNFDSPYQSSSITEFWRRWHISLSSWLKDYLYISLGGNRKGKIRQYFNLMVTMLLGGLWHGASWKFIMWGGLHGIALSIEKMFKIPDIVKKNVIFKIIGVIITFHIVCLCWIFFRATSFESAIIIMKQIVNAFNPDIALQVIVGYKEVFILFALGYALHFIPKNIELFIQNKFSLTPFILKPIVLAMVIWLVIQVKSSDIQPFIYFQF